MNTNGPVDQSDRHFLHQTTDTAATETIFTDDIREIGFVMNASRLWAFQPDTMTGLFDLLHATAVAGGLTPRQRGVLVTATASTLGDSYCSIAWGSRLATVIGDDIAAEVLHGDDTNLTETERAMARWARSITKDCTATVPDDVDALRRTGFTDEQIFAMTVFIALRIAFSTVNASLGARPDAAFRSKAPTSVLDAVTFGRPIEEQATEPPSAIPK